MVMEIFNTEKFYIIWNGFSSLWCDKATGKFDIKNNINPPDESDLECMGIIYGIIGQVRPITNVRNGALLVIAEQTNMGNIDQQKSLFRIDRVAILPFSKDALNTGTSTISPINNESDLNPHLMECIKHRIVQENGKRSDSISQQSSLKKILPLSMSPNLPLQKTWTSIKIAAENALPKQLNYIMNMTDIDENDENKLAAKVYEEIDRLFNTTESFYYSRQVDITNSTQRNQFNTSKDEKAYQQKNFPLVNSDPFAIPTDGLEYDWNICDERFFWNYEISKEILTLKGPLDILSQWVLPIIQGYIHITSFKLADFTNWSLLPQVIPNNQMASEKIINCSKTDLNILSHHLNKIPRPSTNMIETMATASRVLTNTVQGDLSFCLISRRSRHRIGTRYNKRGIDSDGNVANYVETEQIVSIANHMVSYVMTRGSIPVYWSQGGMKYRPPPTLEKNDTETYAAFKKHFDHEIGIYKKITIINLAEQSGREKVISDAYLDNVLKYDSPDLTYVTFDFHEYCQGMKFENISVLTESVADIIKHMQYCWLDTKGFICQQNAVLRINCIDCLDRTNMVEMAFAKIILEIQLRKMGILAPETDFPPPLLQAFQYAWANNGDVLSLQYAGTAALKSDFTRTGQKKLASLFKDGYNSATRYYMNQFRDAYRQLAYDVTARGLRITRDSLSVLIPHQQRQLVTFLITSSEPFTNFFKNMTLPTNSYPDSLNHLNNNNYPPEEIGIEAGNGILYKTKDAVTEYCENVVPPEDELRYGSWKLGIIHDVGGNKEINTKSVTLDQRELNCVVLILTQKAYYVVRYEGEGPTFSIKAVERIPLNDLTCLEYGPYQQQDGTSSMRYLLLLWHTYDGIGGYCHAFDHSLSSCNILPPPPTSQQQQLTVPQINIKLVFQCFKAVLELMNLSSKVDIKEGVPIAKLEPFKMHPSRKHRNPRGEILNIGKTATSLLRRATKDALSVLSISSDNNKRVNAAQDDSSLWNKTNKKHDKSRPNIQSHRPVTAPKNITSPIPNHKNINTEFPKDWEDVLCPGVDEGLVISLAKETQVKGGSGSKGVEPLILEKGEGSHEVGAQIRTDADINSRNYNLMKSKLKCKSRILEL